MWNSAVTSNARSNSFWRCRTRHCHAPWSAITSRDLSLGAIGFSPWSKLMVLRFTYSTRKRCVLKHAPSGKHSAAWHPVRLVLLRGQEQQLSAGRECAARRTLRTGRFEWQRAAGRPCAGRQRHCLQRSGKTTAELRLAVEHADRVTLLIDSLGELERVAALAEDTGQCMRAGVRVTPPSSQWRKFGIPLERLLAFWRRAEQLPLCRLARPAVPYQLEPQSSRADCYDRSHRS